MTLQRIHIEQQKKQPPSEAAVLRVINELGSIELSASAGRCETREAEEGGGAWRGNFSGDTE